MYKIALCGYSGVMGKDVIDEVKNFPEIEIVVKLSPRRNEMGQEYEGNVDCIIDFSRPDNLNFLIDYAKKCNAHLMLFTTGYSEDDFETMKNASVEIPILYSANTAVGIHALRNALKILCADLKDFDLEHVEKHNKRKVDAPSGTGKMIINDIFEMEKREIKNHSLRIGNIPGEHSLFFSLGDEVLEITHRSLSHKVYATGALKLVENFVRYGAGYYNQEDIK